MKSQSIELSLNGLSYVWNLIAADFFEVIFVLYIHNAYKYDALGMCRIEAVPVGECRLSHRCAASPLDVDIVSIKFEERCDGIAQWNYGVSKISA